MIISFFSGKINSFIGFLGRISKTLGPLFGGWTIAYWNCVYAFLIRSFVFLLTLGIVVTYFPYGGTKSKKKKIMSVVGVCRAEGKLLWTLGILSFYYFLFKNILVVF